MTPQRSRSLPRRRSRSSRSPPRRRSRSPRYSHRRHSRSPRSSPPRRSRSSRSPPRKRSRSPRSPLRRHSKSPRSPSRRRSRSPRSPPRRRSKSPRSLPRRRSRSSQSLTRRRSRSRTRVTHSPVRSPSPTTKDDKPQEVAKPNFGLSGKLAAETNTVNGVVLKYHEPSEARKPTKRWRLYVFKDTEQLDVLHVYRQSAYLLGRDRKVADIPIDHPSCSSQHAVLQFRQVFVTDESTGEKKPEVKPYIIDLESTNHTFVNKTEIPTSRYVELRPSDITPLIESTPRFIPGMLQGLLLTYLVEDPGTLNFFFYRYTFPCAPRDDEQLGNDRSFDLFDRDRS
ncbi:11382_t:CDS:2 [Cetraspora pellucida]|uniref:11382_t:CDS:1 n=1 Tax=Cetraspora pellucida TaxID=1433469 RepID=A0ACA9K123_9GLOM|nr:11382_t:CDS:2 [Cetraspora pellucida]